MEGLVALEVPGPGEQIPRESYKGHLGRKASDLPGQPYATSG